jgi:hypothetical protein
VWRISVTLAFAAQNRGHFYELKMVALGLEIQFEEGEDQDSRAQTMKQRKELYRDLKLSDPQSENIESSHQKLLEQLGTLIVAGPLHVFNPLLL